MIVLTFLCFVLFVGVGTTRPTEDLLVLKYGSEASLKLLHARRHEIAAVLINPLCALDVNKPPPADFSLLSNTRGKTDPNMEEYGGWMRRLVETCRTSGIVSISDEVYVGFRYARVSGQGLGVSFFFFLVLISMPMDRESQYQVEYIFHLLHSPFLCLFSPGWCARVLQRQF